MSREKLSQGWSQALALYESARTLNVIEPAFLNGRPRNTHFSAERGFMISWPNGWNPDSMLGEFYGRQLPHEGAELLLVLVPQCLVGGMRPFVAVTVEEGVGESVEAYMESRLQVGEKDLTAVVRSVPADVGSVLRFFHLRRLSM